MSAQFAMNVADAYNYNQQPQMGGFMNPPQPPFPYQNGYTGPGPNSQLSFGYMQDPQVQSPIQPVVNTPYGQMPYGGFSPYQMNMGMGYQGAPMNIPHFSGERTYQNPVPNPVFQQMGSGQATQPIGLYNPFGQNVYYNPMPQDQVVHVPGLNVGGSDYLLPADVEEKCDQLQADMYREMDAAYEKRQQRMQGYYNMNGTNYYGMTYYNSWFDQNIYNQYTARIREIAYEAQEKRRNLNRKLYGCVANCLGIQISPEQEDFILNGYDYVIPGSTLYEAKQQERFSKVVEIDPAIPYRKADAAISAFYQQFNESDNMNDWLGTDCAMFITADRMEAQIHKNRNLSGGYDRGTYRSMLRQYAQEHDIKVAQEVKQKQDQIMEEVKNGNYDNLPTTREEVLNFMLGKDGAQNIINRVNQLNAIASSDNPVGDSRGVLIPTGPPNALGTPVVIADEIEAEYNMRRDAFVNSILAPNSSPNYQGGSG